MLTLILNLTLVLTLVLIITLTLMLILILTLTLMGKVSEKVMLKQSYFETNAKVTLYCQGNPNLTRLGLHWQ